MRRKDREISKDEIFEIINKCMVLRIAMISGDKPYIVPMNFGYSYEGDVLELFFHSAFEGKKIDALKNNPYVCFEMDCGHDLITGENACKYSYRYESVIGEGVVTFLDDMDLKKEALNHLMRHQTGKSFEFDDKAANSVLVFKITVSEISGKARR